MIRIVVFLVLWLLPPPVCADLRVKVHDEAGKLYATIHDGKKLVFTGRGTEPPLMLMLATDSGMSRVAVAFAASAGLMASSMAYRPGKSMKNSSGVSSENWP